MSSPREAGMIDCDSTYLTTTDRIAGQGVVRVLALNRPDKRNALNTELLTMLKTALLAAAGRREVRAVVIHGHGKAFCAGGDVSEFRDASDPPGAMARRARLLGEVLILVRELTVPVVVAAHGPAVGAGAALALSADLTVAEADLRIAFPELRDGAVPAVVMPALAQSLGRKRAFELLTSGRQVSSQDAYEWGLVSAVEPQGAGLSRAFAVADDWATLDPEALKETKSLLSRISALPHREAILAGVEVTARTWRPSGA